MGKKGITPIISVVLLLMMTVGAFGLAYIWLKNFQINVQQEMGKHTQEVLSKAQKSIKIIAVYNDPTTGNTVISIMNNGEVTIRGSEFSSLVVKLDGKLQPSPSVSLTDLAPNNVRTLTFSTDYFTSTLTDGSVHVWEVILGSIDATYNCGPLDPGTDAC